MSEIKKVYYELAQKWHPDKNSNAHAKDVFAEIQEAYEVLSDEASRSVYDTFGTRESFRAAGHRRSYDDHHRHKEEIFVDINSYFGAHHKKNLKGEDIKIEYEINFEEAALGGMKTIEFTRKEYCDGCRGSRCRPGTAPSRCYTCGGRGHLQYRQGQMIMKTPCNTCKGHGMIIKYPCDACGGKGMEHRDVYEAVDIPKGIYDGFIIRYPHKGDFHPAGGEQGDLLVKFTVLPDDYYKREGSDVYSDYFLTITQVVLGDKVKIRTLYGDMGLKIERGTQHGDVITFKGYGIENPRLEGGKKGDHHVTLKVMIPREVNAEEKKLYEELYAVQQRNTASKPRSQKSSHFPQIFSSVYSLYFLSLIHI
eukprot:TRINITY_DN14152_c0_g1_i3.p1 TRINITY_DN14152_c0_g1~~TRINITY_DN14152_c0_g1_i3.p1  ORF type:complete len:365 (+),score=11.45 TRINITY_DN14152_c0_g1_i3:206-1300(+)